MTTWIIRPAVPNDAIALATCIDAAYARYRARIKDLPPVSAGLAHHIKSHLVWVAEIDQLIVGGLVLVPEDGFARLANIAVDPNVAGRGIGRGLIEQAKAHCRALNVGELRLSTHVEMPGNIALYESLGWQETNRSGNKVYMTKFL